MRGADTARLDLAPQCAGLLAISLGLGVMHQGKGGAPADDQALLRDGMKLYDALHAWLASARGERHGWDPAALRAAGAAGQADGR